MRRVLAILACSLWLSGCFIFEEIRKGDALIEQHSVGWRDKKNRMQEAEKEVAKTELETHSRKASDGGPGVKDKFSEWWRDTVAEEPVTADPSDKLVSCEIQGKMQFLRKSDCELRRGRMRESKAKSASSAIAPSPPKPGA